MSTPSSLQRAPVASAFAEYEDYDALGLAELVRTRQVHPAELVECARRRVEAYNPALNAVVMTLFDQALAATYGPLRPGPFAGVPFLLKDLDAALAGVPMTASSRALARFVPPGDSALVARYRRAGFIVIGKTNTPELGLLPVTESEVRGPARNPWNPDHTPGGSSGGSAAAVAAGMVPAAHGNDGGGSIRIPASCCALFGLKPSRGRNPTEPGAGEACGAFAEDHVLTRTVRDSAALLDATCGALPGATHAAPTPAAHFLDEVGRDPGRLRIAFTAEPLFGHATHPECRAAVEGAARLCEELGHEVEDAVPPLDRVTMVQAFLTVMAVRIHRTIALIAEATGRAPSPRDYEARTWAVGLAGRAKPADALVRALEACSVAAHRMAAFFQRYDILLTPTQAAPPVLVGAFTPTAAERVALQVLHRLPLGAALEYMLHSRAQPMLEATANTMPFNMTGQPAASVPLHWTAEGLPVGVQLVAAHGAEALLFRLAAQLEHARPWFARRPPLAQGEPAYSST